MKIIIKIYEFFNNLLKNEGLAFVIIIGLILLGLFDIGLIFKIQVSSKIIFLSVGIAYMIFHKPKMWDFIKQFFLNLFNINR